MSTTDNLLRFLTQEAKLSLASAIAQAKHLQKADLVTIEDLAKTDFATLKSASADEKSAKATLAAAKRVSIKRKRGLPETSAPLPSKRVKPDPVELKSPAEVEASLELPVSDLDETELENISLVTNRAPLMLVFAFALLKYTMPDQPPSTRLSLAQAVTSMNARTKAANIGLDKAKSAEDEGWGQHQPSVKVMGRDVRVLKRWGYEWRADAASSNGIKVEDTDEKKPKLTDSVDSSVSEESPALWALDLEQLKHFNGPPLVSSSTNAAGLPVYSAEAARTYVLRAFDVASSSESGAKKKTSTQTATEREANLGHLVKALDLLFQSWSTVLDPSALDKRAWNWYVKVRPQVESGVSGWGAKGQVKLRDILELRRTP